MYWNYKSFPRHLQNIFIENKPILCNIPKRTCVFEISAAACVEKLFKLFINFRTTFFYNHTANYMHSICVETTAGQKYNSFEFYTNFRKHAFIRKISHLHLLFDLFCTIQKIVIFHHDCTRNLNTMLCIKTSSNIKLPTYFFTM